MVGHNLFDCDFTYASFALAFLYGTLLAFVVRYFIKLVVRSVGACRTTCISHGVCCV